MITPEGESGVAAFRTKLLTAMTLVVVSLTLAGVYVAEHSVQAEARNDLQGAFASEVALIQTVRGIRHASLAERCRALVRKPRIHAALEDNALDLLYPSAREELGDPLPTDETSARFSIRPRFYRFLDINGAVIPPLNAPEAGALAPDEEARLALAAVPLDQQNGSLVRANGEIVEVIATPIISTETGESIAALVAGFPTAANEPSKTGRHTGLWMDGVLHLKYLAEPARADLERELGRMMTQPGGAAPRGLRLVVDGVPQMLFVERLNPGSVFPPAFEVGLFPLTDLLSKERALRTKAALAGAVLLGLGMAASYYVSERLAAPVRQLAAVSAENRILRDRAENALELKTSELERSARFSADASHQLKTPVAVLRAGLDELLAREEVSAEVSEELSLLVHQTFRLTSIIEDLLLLSRLDTGRLQLTLTEVDLAQVVATCIDDLLLLHEPPLPNPDNHLPPGLPIAGDRRYTMLIVQNLLDNARKYGRPGSPIRLTTHPADGRIVLGVANRGQPIPRPSWQAIFERFHRGTVGENIPGHGLGLNLARELARLHGGDLRLSRSDDEWTEFEVCFLPAPSARPSLILP